MQRANIKSHEMQSDLPAQCYDSQSPSRPTIEHRVLRICRVHLHRRPLHLGNMVKKHLLTNYLVTLVACLNYILNGYDGSLYSSFQVMQPFLNHFGNPSPYWIGMINTAPGIAATVYAFFIAALVNDYLGRRRTIFVAGVANMIGALIQTFAPNIGAYMAGRAISSISMAQSQNAAPLFVAEIALSTIRGRLVSFWQMFWSFGAIEAAYISLGTSYYSNLGNWMWKIPCIIQLVTPLMVCSMIFFCPESPRWLVGQGRIEEARASLLRVRLPEDVEDELKDIQGAVVYEAEVTKGRYKQWFVNKSYAKRLVIVFGLFLGQQLGGQGVLTQYSGIIYQSVFHSSTTSILLNGLNWALAVLYVLPATFFVDRVGRRPILLIGAIGQATAMMGVATVVTQVPKQNGHYTFGVGVGAVFFVYLYNLFYQASWGCTTWVVATEVFPLNVRAQGLAISSQVEGAVMTALGVAFPTFLANDGFYAFYFFMGVNIVAFAGVFFFLPETKQRSLEEMDHLFGGEDHGKAGRMIMSVEDGRAFDDNKAAEERVETVETVVR